MIQGLKKAQIVYTTLIEDLPPFKDSFETVQDLAKYFDAHKRKGEVVGYVILKNRTPGFKDYIVSGKLTVEWWDANGYASKDFEQVNSMVEFFHEHPTIGMMLKYKRKLKNQKI